MFVNKCVVIHKIYHTLCEPIQQKSTEISDMPQNYTETPMFIFNVFMISPISGAFNFGIVIFMIFLQVFFLNEESISYLTCLILCPIFSPNFFSWKSLCPLFLGQSKRDHFSNFSFTPILFPPFITLSYLSLLTIQTCP